MYPVQNASIPRTSQLIEGIEIKSPLKLQPQMTRRSRQPVAPLHRCTVACCRRRERERPELGRGGIAGLGWELGLHWGCGDYFIGCIGSERKCQEKLHAAVWQAEVKRGKARGGGSSRVVSYCCSVAVAARWRVMVSSRRRRRSPLAVAAC